MAGRTPVPGCKNRPAVMMKKINIDAGHGYHFIAARHRKPAFRQKIDLKIDEEQSILFLSALVFAFDTD